MDKLVSKEQVAQAARMRSSNPLVGVLYRLSGIDRVNRFYEGISDRRDLDFVSSSLSLLDLKIEVSDEDLARIPETGGFITVSNHPFGAIDGLALLHLIGRKRPDFKVMANFLLQRIDQVSDRFIAVNPFEDATEQSSISGIRSAMIHLDSGSPLGIFPAGEVSTFQKDLRTITDGPWSTSSIRLIERSGMPVIPIYFDGKNSRLFHLLGAIHPSLRTLRLPAELMNKRGKTLRVRIGKPIAAKHIASFEHTNDLLRYLRAKTYSLGSGMTVKREYFSGIRRLKKVEEILPAVGGNVLQTEVDQIADLRLFDHQEFECYAAPANRIPNVLKEIGRLREVTFREVGEGTNKALDLDGYDLYYDHLFLWDKEKQAIAGAYRIGRGHEIMRRYGRRGFYINSLFKLDEHLDPVLQQSIELGRSFVTTAYQKQRMPLFLLWKGILVTLIKYPEFRYVIGPVTISGSYTEVSKGLIMEFIRRHYFHNELAKHVTPRKPYIVSKQSVDREALLKATENDMKKLDRIIADIEPSSHPMPVLLKKYLHQNARILGFNLDPLFNNALDGLMLLDLYDLPQETVDNLQREFGTMEAD
jgi:putative hemolysin